MPWTEWAPKSQVAALTPEWDGLRRRGPWEEIRSRGVASHTAQEESLTGPQILDPRCPERWEAHASGTYQGSRTDQDREWLYPGAAPSHLGSWRSGPAGRQDTQTSRCHLRGLQERGLAPRCDRRLSPSCPRTELGGHFWGHFCLPSFLSQALRPCKTRPSRGGMRAWAPTSACPDPPLRTARLRDNPRAHHL